VTKIKAWDVCAADALIRSGGGDFTDLHGYPLSYDPTTPVFSGGLIASATKERQSWYVEKLEGYVSSSSSSSSSSSKEEKKGEEKVEKEEGEAKKEK